MLLKSGRSREDPVAEKDSRGHAVACPVKRIARPIQPIIPLTCKIFSSVGSDSTLDNVADNDNIPAGKGFVEILAILGVSP